MRHDWISARQGSALISAAIGGAILSIVAASLLLMLSNEYNFNFRSRSWNQALHLAEAGIEIGFAEINNQSYRGGSGVAFQSARGWTLSSNVYYKTVTGFTNAVGAVVGDIAISVSGMSGINPIVTAISTVTTSPRGPAISRAVWASLYSSSMFPAGMVAKNSINMNGNNIYSDSYNSTDVSKSTSGLYDAAKKQANGNIASNGSVIDSLSIGNADIYGTVYTGPGGTATLGPSGSIGPTFVSGDRATSVAAGEAAGYIEHDFNVDVADVILPDGAASWTSSGIPGGKITSDKTLNTGDYKVSQISLTSNSHKDTLEINGNVRIYVTGNVSLSGLSQIIIDPGASLQVYVAGSSVSLTGNGIINNSAQPIDNQWYGLSTSTSWTYTGNAQWIGTIYAPEATVSFKGGGSSGDASGSVVANNITLAGQVQFHYDEALRASDTGAGFAVVAWQELRNVNDTWVP